MTNGEQQMLTATRVYDRNWNLVGSVDQHLDGPGMINVPLDNPLAHFLVTHNDDHPVYAVASGNGYRWAGGLSEIQVLRTLDTKAKFVRATFTDEPPRDRIKPPPGVA